MVRRFSRHKKKAYLCIAVPLFLYIVLRASLVCLTHDECLTYGILNGVEWIRLTANNHLLNTFLTYVSTNLLGVSEFSLRLPNVVGFIVYLFFCYKLVVEKANNCLSIFVALSILLFNHLLLDFFSLSRGYGLALAATIGSYYYYIESLRDPNSYKKVVFATFLGVLAIYANFSLIIAIISVWLSYTLGIILIVRPERKAFVKFIVVCCSAFLLLLPAVHRIFSLKNKDELYFGGEESFVTDTLYSLFDLTFGLSSFDKQLMFWNIVICLFLFFCALFSRINIRLLFAVMVMFCSVIIPIGLHHILGVKYPLDRTALYLVLYFGLLIYFMLESFHSEHSSTFQPLCKIICSVIALVCLAGFITSTNISYTKLWKFDAGTKVMLETLDKVVDHDRYYYLGVEWFLEPVINFYRIHGEYEWLKPVTRMGLYNRDYDFYYVVIASGMSFDCTADEYDFPYSGTRLLRACQE